MTRYAGRRAVIVGGCDGIGLAVAKRLVEGGAEAC
jgi:NAD(P)-dependent dehydrogenase (short-subunit alcohol dehydrogenase family)